MTKAEVEVIKRYVRAVVWSLAGRLGCDATTRTLLVDDVKQVERELDEHVEEVS